MAPAQVFDYVIVGAGSAGCVLAARLSADPRPVCSCSRRAAGTGIRSSECRLASDASGASIGLIGATPPSPAPPPATATSRWRAASSSAARIPSMPWATSAAILTTMIDGRGSGFPAGRSGICCRISSARKSWEGRRERVSRRLRPDLCSPHEGHRSALRGLHRRRCRAGHPYTEDYNGADQHGFAWAQWTIRAGLRDTTARGYLHPARRRRNLTIVTHALAARVVIESRRAVGVDYLRHGRRTTARAAREVILCGGAVNTPQLLMLSGIGDPDHLRDMGIAPVSAAARRRRQSPGPLLDRLDARAARAWPLCAVTRADRLAVAFARAYFAGTGPATDVPSGFMAFVKTDSAMTSPISSSSSAPARRDAGPWFPGFKKPWQDAFVCRPILLRPASRGRILLRSDNPAEHPRIRSELSRG